MRVQVVDYRLPCGAIILPNPNAPTGIALPLAEIETLLRDHPDQVVVIDEAYVDFGAESAIPLVKTYPNLLVVHTFSKSRSLAGLRVGFAVGQRPLIEAMERVKDSFNSYPLDRLALAGAVAAWTDQEWFETHRQRIIASREALTVALQGLGFEVLPSAANFLFARHPDRAGKELAAALREKAILIRHFQKERIGDFLRITVGTEAECARLVEALGEVLG
jgi:histidinol-phosphate aminotransferase